jgi:DNA mismatch endonuclease (patch repair protein)
MPKTRTKWWKNKINRNKELDEQNLTKLSQSGWTVLTVFGCELKPKRREQTLNELARRLEQIANIHKNVTELH